MAMNTVLAYKTTASEAIPYKSIFLEAARHYGVEPSLLMAIAEQESNFDANAVNVRSETDMDIGIMQIWTNWLPTLSSFNINKEDLYKPEVNIYIGAWILSSNFASHGINENSLGAYNAGFRKRNQHIRDQYVAKIKPKLNRYRKLLDTNNYE